MRMKFRIPVTLVICGIVLLVLGVKGLLTIFIFPTNWITDEDCDWTKLKSGQSVSADFYCLLPGRPGEGKQRKRTGEKRRARTRIRKEVLPLLRQKTGLIQSSVAVSPASTLLILAASTASPPAITSRWTITPSGTERHMLAKFQM